MNRVKWLVLGLGFGGIVPAYGCLYFMSISDSPAYWGQALTWYAALIITFVGAISWGHALSHSSISDAKRCFLLIWGIAPAVSSWFCLFLPHPLIVGPLIGLYLLALALDSVIHQSVVISGYWIPMRAGLTVGMVFALALSAYLAL